MRRWVTILIGRSYGRRISKEAAKLPDPLTRLRYLRRQTRLMPPGWLEASPKIRWTTIATVALTLTMIVLLWRMT